MLECAGHRTVEYRKKSPNSDMNVGGGSAVNRVLEFNVRGDTRRGRTVKLKPKRCKKNW